MSEYSEFAEIVKRVAVFTEGKDSMHQSMLDLHFRKGTVHGVCLVGGAIEPIDLELECGVNAKRMLKALQACKGAEIPSFEVDGHVMVVSNGSARAKLETSRSSASPNFPKPPAKAAWRAVPSLHAAHTLAWATSKDTARPNLGGVALTKSGIVATNGNIAVKLGSEDYHDLLGVRQDLVVPTPALKGLPAPTFALAHDGRLFLAAEPKPKAYRYARLIDASFPPVDQVMQCARDHERMVVDRKELVDMIKRSKLSGENAVLEVVKGRINIRIDEQPDMALFGFADTIGFAPAQDKAPPNGIIGLNLGYLLPAVQMATSEKVVLGLKPAKDGGLDPIYLLDVREEDDGGMVEAVLMPLRI